MGRSIPCSLGTCFFVAILFNASSQASFNEKYSAGLLLGNPSHINTSMYSLIYVFSPQKKTLSDKIERYIEKEILGVLIRDFSMFVAMIAFHLLGRVANFLIQAPMDISLRY
jgi:hypothetical protein